MQAHVSAVKVQLEALSPEFLLYSYYWQGHAYYQKRLEAIISDTHKVAICATTTT